jgi:hypothetical protein
MVKNRIDEERDKVRGFAITTDHDKPLAACVLADRAVGGASAIRISRSAPPLF